MSDPKVLKVNGLEIELPYVKRDFGSAEVATAYGDVLVTVDGKSYTMRIGEKEWWAAQEAFKVKGIDAIIEKANSDERNMAMLYKIALSRHHKDTKLEDIADMMDWTDDAGRRPLRDALERCLTFKCPAKFPDEDLDPKALRAALALIAEKKNQQAASTS